MREQDTCRDILVSCGFEVGEPNPNAVCFDGLTQTPLQRALGTSQTLQALRDLGMIVRPDPRYRGQNVLTFRGYMLILEDLP